MSKNNLDVKDVHLWFQNVLLSEILSRMPNDGSSEAERIMDLYREELGGALRREEEEENEKS